MYFFYWFYDLYKSNILPVLHWFKHIVFVFFCSKHRSILTSSSGHNASAFKITTRFSDYFSVISFYNCGCFTLICFSVYIYFSMCIFFYTPFCIIHIYINTRFKLIIQISIARMSCYHNHCF